MEAINKSRWGIVALSVFMLFVTMVNASINGQKNSFYYAVWIFVAWYGYKGNLEQIRSWLKLLIIINILAIVGIAIFVENNITDLVIKGATKESMVIGILVMLIPKIFLYMYCGLKINDKNTELGNSGAQIISAPILKKNDDEMWEKVAEEFESEKRKKGLYAKLFAETNGDEIKIKAMYYKIRIEEMNAAEKESFSKFLKSDKKGYEDISEEDCIRFNWFEKFTLNGYECLDLYNGKALVITPKRKLVYKNLAALQNAMTEQKRSGIFTNENKIKDIFT